MSCFIIHELHELSGHGDKISSSVQTIEAGFFRCNVGDRMISLYCNLICQQWPPHTDDPCEVHRALSPNCIYVKANLIRAPASSTATSSGVMGNTNVTKNRGQLWIPDERTLSEFVEARLDLPISRRLLDQGFKLSIIKRCWEDQLRFKLDDFVSGSDVYVACKILQKQIDHINGKKENIVIPHVEMERIREQNAVRTCDQTVSTPDGTQSVSRTTGADTTDLLQPPTNETMSTAVHDEINQMIQYDSIHPFSASRKKND